MFTCAKIRDGSTYLSSHLSANDYYAEGEHVTGTWIGKGAELLGLQDLPIGKEDAAFEALRLNQHPCGSGQLTPRNVQDSIRFYDFQCAPHKSVSVMAVTLGDARLGEAHDRASRRALVELEKFAAVQTSRGHRKRRETTGNICAAAFRHDASRDLDPQLHTHFVVANATWDSRSCRWLALETHDMFKAIRYAGKFYQNELARECRRLGYEVGIVRNGKGAIEGFQIEGVPTEICQRFSKRRSEIEAAVFKFTLERGREPTVAEIASISKETRTYKLKETTTPQVLAAQQAQLTADELSALEHLRDRAISTPAREPNLLRPQPLLETAKHHLFERYSVLAAHEVLAETLNQGLGSLDPSTLSSVLHSPEAGLVPLDKTNEPLNQNFATKEGLALERWAVAFVNSTREKFRPLGPTDTIPFEFSSDEQRRVVMETLDCRDQVCAIRGMAGAGKTTSLREISRALASSGQPVYYLAPTASAAKVLRGDGFGTATTVADFLTNHVRQDKDRVRGSVLVVDEAGLQSNQLGGAILKGAQKASARVLFVGDSRQHVAVEAGDFLRILERHSQLQCFELRDIRRQVVREYNRAIREMARGDAQTGFDHLRKLGWVQERHTSYLQAAAEAFLQQTDNGRQFHQALAVCPTWVENYQLTDAIRNRLKATGYISDGHSIVVNDSLNWTRSQLADVHSYRPGLLVTFTANADSIRRGSCLVVERVVGKQIFFAGYEKPFEPRWHAHRIDVAVQRPMEVSIGDRLLIRRNDRKSGLVNGDVLTVRQIAADGTIHTHEGATIPSLFRDYCHGYVVTSHRAQGRTHASVIVAARELDSKAAYVACSRGRELCSVFTPDLEHLRQRLPRSGDRPAALDVLLNSSSPALPDFPPSRQKFSHLWESIRANGLIEVLRFGWRRSFGPPSIPEPMLKRPFLDFSVSLEH